MNADKKLWDRVVKTQEEFVYEKMFDTEHYRGWYCHKPGTGVYNFELIFGMRGIYINGDIDSLVFSVARGLGFLAGDDIDYYIHSKLDEAYREQYEIDPVAMEQWVMATVIEFLEEEKPEFQPPSFASAREAIDCYIKNSTDSDREEGLEQILDVRSREDFRAVLHAHNLVEYEYPYVERPSYSIRFPLYMACYAARRIRDQEMANARQSFTDVK